MDDGTLTGPVPSVADRSPAWLAAAGVRLLLELGALSAIGLRAGAVGGSGVAAVATGLAGVLLVATVWGLFGAPNARYRLPRAGRLLLEAGLFGGATWALWDLGWPAIAAMYGLVAAVDAVAFHALGGD